MSSSTPNINLTLPIGSEKVSRQIINDNNTKIDTAIGVLNSNLSNLNSDVNSTADILADALSCTTSKLFKGSGTTYTGTLPAATFKYAVFFVNARGSYRYVIAQNASGDVAVNAYNGSWAGWQELATDSKTIYKAGDTITGTFRAYGRMTNNKDNLYVTMDTGKRIIANNATIIITAIDGIYGTQNVIAGSTPLTCALQGLANDASAIRFTIPATASNAGGIMFIEGSISITFS